MKAIRLQDIGKPLQVDHIPLPQVGPRDILVKIRAAGICHSDVHYRSGASLVSPLPRTLGHEIAGVVEATGSEVATPSVGDRVCLHYLVTCGECSHCRTGHEQFCAEGAMLGKNVDGGYAEYIAVPARNAVPLPEEVSFEHGAVLMSKDSYFAIPAYPLEALKDPTGAGDTFAGGFIGWLDRTGDVSVANMRKAVVYGSVLASHCVEEFSIEGIRDLSEEQIAERFNTFRTMSSF